MHAYVFTGSCNSVHSGSGPTLPAALCCRAVLGLIGKCIATRDSPPQHVCKRGGRGTANTVSNPNLLAKSCVKASGKINVRHQIELINLS